jgi:hypothetical protein
MHIHDCAHPSSLQLISRLSYIQSKLKNKQIYKLKNIYKSNKNYNFILLIIIFIIKLKYLLLLLLFLFHHYNNNNLFLRLVFNTKY